MRRTKQEIMSLGGVRAQKTTRKTQIFITGETSFVINMLLKTTLSS